MVDILLATYNGEKYIKEQLDSIFNQSYSEFKVIIRDDGSIDRTVDIINEYIRKFGQEKIKLVNDNVACGSPQKNFIRLLSYANSDYVMFCDQDDVWYPNKIEVTYNAMKKIEYDKNIPILVYTDYKLVDDNLTDILYNEKKIQIYGKNIDLSHLLVQNYVTGCTMMINRTLYCNVDKFYDEILMHDWWFSIYAASFGLIHHEKVKTIMYRQHFGQSVGAVNVSGTQYIISMIKSGKSKTSMQKYVAQAKRFYVLFNSKMNVNTKNLFLEFISIPKSCKIIRIYKLFRYRFLKSTFARRIGQIWYV